MSERPTPETHAFADRSFFHREDEMNKLYEFAENLERQRDEARELCRELADLVAYGLGQSGEQWSFDAMHKATYAIQKTKQLEGEK